MTPEVAAHNVVHIHNNAMHAWQYHVEYSIVHSYWTQGMFRKIMSVPHDVVMDMKNATHRRLQISLVDVSWESALNLVEDVF